MPQLIAEPCIGVKDGSCVDVCPVDCIRTDPGAAQFFIDPLECIDCGVCTDVCPVQAIFKEEDLPGPFKSFADLNRRYFRRD